MTDTLNKMESTSIISKNTGNISKFDTLDLVLNEPSVVVLEHSKDEIKNIARDGDNLIITLNNGEVIKVENFFSLDNSLVLKNNGELLWAQFSDLNNVTLATVNYVGIEQVEPLLYDNESSVLPFVAGVLGAIGTGVVIAHDSSNNGKNNDQ
uniref:BapA/Bap/LapF family prefix-like domain-containing protein n=1 Tax=Acinetobacter sp. CFCC 10889 TaxID=1775557 RepID=UPI0013A688AD